MAEYRLQQTDYPSTLEFHKYRERAPHLEQNWQNARLYYAAKLVRKAKPKSVVDLGCGDGGLLSLIKDIVPCWGYDFCPANAEGWKERGVTARQADVFNTEFTPVWGELTVITEVLEHLADPHGAVEWISKNSKYIVASSPYDERPNANLCEGEYEHLWGWDKEGYTAMIGAHFKILEWRKVDWSQVVLAESKYVKVFPPTV